MNTLPHLLIMLASMSVTTAGAFDIPHIANATIDGNLNEWAAKAFTVEVFADKEGRTSPPDDLHPRLLLGWDPAGLLVGVEVHDDIGFEQGTESTMWDGDSLEIFVSEAVGSQNMIHLVVSPGVTDGYPEIRTKAYGFRTGAPGHEPKFAVARTQGDTGYTFETRIEFSSLGIVPALGHELGFQVFVNDMDDAISRFQAIWYPQTRTHENADRVHPIVLARKAGPPVLARTRAGYDSYARGYLDIIAVPSWVGRDVRVTAERRRLADGALAHVDGWARTSLSFPFPAPGETLETLHVRAGRHKLPEVALPDAEEIRARRLLDLELAFDRYVFTGTAFPRCEFRNPLLAERMIGQYDIAVEFVDAEFNSVPRADGVGRYGAMVTVTPKRGDAFVRYQTLFCAPSTFARYNRSFSEVDGSVTWPAELGLDEAAIARQRDAIARYLNHSVSTGYTQDETMAVLLAGMWEDNQPGPERTVADDAVARDRQWWVTLKRLRNGNATAFPAPFVAPRTAAGNPAPELRPGTPEEASMDPAVITALDALLDEWWEQSQEPFATCIARNGVIFYHKAFGERDGTPMTVDRPSWMASISKLMSGTLMMMLVDQGLVDLEDRVDQYLPSLRGIEVEKPLTIRHLYTHTNGFQLDGFAYRGQFPDHWGDAVNDLEEIVAGYYPRLKVAQRHGYNGVGYAVGGKVIEQVTGEAIPQFYKRHLLDPLGMTHTRAIDTSAFIFSTPEDIARWGQMLLNKGAYGNQRFFGESTFERMLPQPLAPVLGQETDLEWGIGMVWMPEPGLSEKTFGHGAASAATLRIDPEHKLVITMTRNSGGPKYWDYHPKFIETIAAHLRR